MGVGPISELPYYCLNLGRRGRHFRTSEGEHVDLAYSTVPQSAYAGGLDRAVRERFKLERELKLTIDLGNAEATVN